MGAGGVTKVYLVRYRKFHANLADFAEKVHADRADFAEKVHADRADFADRFLADIADQRRNKGSAIITED
jgi:hypothetical protein